MCGNVHVCSHWMAWGLDNGLRRLFWNPTRVVSEFIKAGDRVVDIGCGPGFFTLPMADLVGESGSVLAIDLQPQMLEKVSRKRRTAGYESRIQLHQCSPDSLNLTEENGLFDFALAYYMIHEVPDIPGLLRELKARMKPGGTVLVVEPPFHVSRVMFDKTLDLARSLGYGLDFPSSRKGGRAALLIA